MGLRTWLKNQTWGRWKKFADEADAWVKAEEEKENVELMRKAGRHPDGSPLPKGDVLKTSIEQTLSATQSRNTQVVSVSSAPAPVISRQEPPADVVSERVEIFDPSTLSCEQHEVSVDATIDYIDKLGNFTRRDITTEEIYDYEDGVLVIRAFCHKRKDYRTFISKRIRYWVDSHSGKPVPVQNLADYLIRRSRVDLANLAFGAVADVHCEVKLFKYYVGRYTNTFSYTKNGIKRFEVEKNLAEAFSEFVLTCALQRKTIAAREISALRPQQKDELRQEIVDRIFSTKVTEAQLHLCRRILKDRNLARRKTFIDAVKSVTAELPGGSSVTQVLEDDLLDPSFKIDYGTFLKQVEEDKSQTIQEIKSEAEEAEEELATVSKTEPPKSKARSKKHRKSAELNVIRNLARQECHTQLLKNLQEGVMIIEREPFEQEIRRRVCALLTEEEIAKYGDMMLPYLGNGIQFGYLVTGLKKKNRGWYPNESGKVVIDLNNIEQD